MNTNNTQNTNLAKVISELHKAFDYLNQAFYKNQLPQVVITIQAKGKRNALGWFSTGKIWADGTQSKHEINISAEYTDRDYLEIMKTLHHEMIHLYCCENNIKDTSRAGTYHNTNFRTACERHGFYYPQDTPDKKYGWSFSELTDETIEIINGFDIDRSVFKLKRADISQGVAENKKKKSNIIKWTCECGNIVRTSKELNIICGDCMTQFKKSEE